MFVFYTFSNVFGQIDAFGFHFKKAKQKRIAIPFRQYNNLIVIPVTVNGAYDTLNFVLDTGVGYTLITDPAVQERLGLTCVRTIKISGLGKEKPLNACVVKIDHIGIGRRIVAKNQYVVVLEQDILALSRYAGVRIHGLLGYELFSRFVVEIDYPSQRLILTRPNFFVPKIRPDVQVLPISIEDMKPYVEVEAMLKDDSTQKATFKLLLDTGAGHSLSLDVGTHPDIQIPEKNLPAQLGMTLNGSVDGVIGRINALRVGKVLLQNVITTFPDSISIANRTRIGSIFRQGNIGCGILSRFRLTFDYTHKKLYLKPNRSLKEPFEFSTSGIELIAIPPHYTEVQVGGVRPNSPADRIGLQAGDKIMAVDEHLTKELRLGEIYKLINQKAGTRISLLIQLSEGNFQIIELLLENPL